jgi:hypothetical protein
LVNFKLHDYQKEFTDSFENNRFSILCCARQVGKSTTSAAWLTWKTLFTPNYQVAILANKRETSYEMIERITRILENLPLFLQPGAKEINRGSISFSNYSKISAHATSPTSVSGKSLSALFLD